MAGPVQETWSPEMLGGQGDDLVRLLAKGFHFGRHQILRLAEMILCGGCSISYDLASLEGTVP